MLQLRPWKYCPRSNSKPIVAPGGKLGLRRLGSSGKGLWPMWLTVDYVTPAPPCGWCQSGDLRDTGRLPAVAGQRLFGPPPPKTRCPPRLLPRPLPCRDHTVTPLLPCFTIEAQYMYCVLQLLCLTALSALACSSLLPFPPSPFIPSLSFAPTP